MLNNFEIEKKERQYSDLILLHLKQDLPTLIEGLNSRIKVLNDWYQNFIQTARSGYKASDLDTGAERIFHHFFASILRFPNSSPLGSDLMFELPDAFIHIEVKTALIGNPADYKGKINVAINQTSYGAKGILAPNLPQYYKPEGNAEKVCLTYIIQIIHEHAKPNIKALVLACIPNGQLYSVYGKSIFRAGKTKRTSFRYMYSAEPYFKLLTKRYKEKIFRVQLVYLGKALNVEDITTLSDIPVYFQF